MIGEGVGLALIGGAQVPLPRFEMVHSWVIVSQVGGT